jgi:two-component system sensor histidine kinase PhoQ
MIPGSGSLAGRLLLASALLLPLFLGVTGFYLGHSHRRGIEAAEAERLQLWVLTLLAEAEYDTELVLPAQLLEARFNQQGSGIYALVTAADGKLLWSSPSAATLPPAELAPDLPRLAPGERRFQRRRGLFSLSHQVVWQTGEGGEAPLLFTVLETAEPLDAEVRSYRRSLLLWLGGSAVVLVACQAAILAWGLRPLRELARDIDRIESGVSERLGGPYPREVQALTDNLNTLLSSESRRRERMRHILSDLAHSLKTPLAVLRSADTGSADHAELVREQVERMDQIVSWQLQRSVEGGHKLLQTVPVLDVARRLRGSLLKVYAAKSPGIALEIGAECRFRGDERDLMELLGNLIDNACKYCRGEVRVSAARGQQLVIAVEDDGAGIPRILREVILERGVRADVRHEGQGIGLAVAADIVASYQGELRVCTSELGGARVALRFP